MADLGLAGTWVTWPWPSGTAGPAVEKEAAAAAMPAATKWEVDWFDPDLENLNKLLQGSALRWSLGCVNPSSPPSSFGPRGASSRNLGPTF